MKKSVFFFFMVMIFISLSAYAEEQEGNNILAINGSTEISVPLYEPEFLPVTGTATGSISIENLSPALIEVNADQIANSIIIKGLQIGQATFVLVRDKVRVPIYVAVKEPAGILPQKIYITVTGNPASKDFLKEAALRAVFSQTVLKPRSYLLFDEYVPFNGPAFLARGETKTFELPVKIESQIYFPVRASVSVEVSNKIISTSDTAILMISNRPEKIEDDGILFQEDIKPDKPVRLLFYHQNSLESSQREFILKITNPSTDIVEMKLISGVSGPDQDVFYAGHKSTVRFLESYASEEGQIIKVKPKEEVVLFKALMKPGEVVSGLVEIHILNDKPLRIITQAGQPNVKPQTLLPDEFDPFKINPKGIFPKPDISSDISYNIGDKELSIPIGASPWLLDINNGSPNQGNYGVIYKINLLLNNYDKELHSVKIHFAPINGIARGVFVINGKLCESDLIKPGNTSLISEILLSPKERKIVKIFTTPQSASCYPVKITVKSE